MQVMAPQKTALTPDDITTIRELLPYDWRRQIHATNPEITVRAISEVFNLRTTNPQRNAIVWGVIKKMLLKLGHQELAKKVQYRIDQTNLN